MSRLSMKEIASELHLSINAVSLALNNRPGVSEETRRAVIEKAKETYEFVTGDEFVDRAAAEKWIAEEYQPSDPPPPLDSAK